VEKFQEVEIVRVLSEVLFEQLVNERLEKKRVVNGNETNMFLLRVN
jgi:hypothetical protein